MNPQKTALILVGFQNDYFAKDGILRGVVEEPNRVDEVLANSLAFIRTALDAGVTVISTPITLTPDYRALANAVGILDTIKESGAFKEGSTGADTVPELAALGDRIMLVMGKVEFNAFSNTDLDRVLRSRGITHVLVAGLVTSLCIDSTGRAAYERGYAVTMLSDCCSARTSAEHDFYCRTIFPLYCDVATGAQVAEAFAAVTA